MCSCNFVFERKPASPDVASRNLAADADAGSLSLG